MRFFVIIATTIIHLSLADSATVGRCCRTGEALVLNARQLECVQLPRDKQLQQFLLSAEREGQQQEQQPSNGLPDCDRSSHQVRIPGEDATEVPEEACLELFHDETTSLNFPILVQCSSKTNRANNAIFSRIQAFRLLSQASMFRRAPRIVHLRKCCPLNTAYDPVSKLCREQTTADSEGTDFRVLFDRLPSLDFIDVYAHGVPTCRDDAVLVDFTPRQLYLQHSATDASVASVAGAAEISISIPQIGSSLRNVTISGDTSCLDSYGGEVVVRLCRELDYCEANSCVRKCCSADGLSNDTRCAAVAPTFQNFSIALGNIKNYGLIVGVPCRDVFGPDDDLESWWLDDTGNVILRPNDGSFTDVYSYSNACLDFMLDERGFTPMLCLPDSDDGTPLEKWKVAGSLQIISCFFLALTFAVYCCLPSLQNLHGKTLMCHVASLFVAYATLVVNQFASDSFGPFGEIVEDTMCRVMGYVMLLGFHSAFFWLNVMCFDIWWTFRGFREAKRYRQTGRFLAYCLYAWGSSLFFVVLLLSLHLAGILGDIVGKKRCWLENHTIGHVVFFLLPVNLTLVVNLVFFIVTARRCSKVKEEINRAMATDVKCARNFQSDRSRLIVSAKLFVVMGIPYIFENLSAFLSNYEVIPMWLNEVFYAVDVITSLQGVWIFILFVLKSKVYEALRKRLSSSSLAMKKSMSSSNVLLSVNKPNEPRVRKSASSTTITSCFLSTSN